MERRKSWLCYEILHAGEGPRGRDVEILLKVPGYPIEAAREAADYFDRIEMHDEGLGNADLDGGIRYIEVDGGGKFTVTCQIERKYHAGEGIF